MTYDDNDKPKHDSAAGAAWIVFAIVIALLVVTAIYWSGHNSKTASNKGGAPTSQTTGSDAASKNATTGSGSTAR